MAGGTQMTAGTAETSTPLRGSSTGSISAEEVGDRVFGEYTKDGPTVREGTHMESNIPHPWEHYFDGDRPDWYLPWPDPRYPELVKP